MCGICSGICCCCWCLSFDSIIWGMSCDLEAKHLHRRNPTEKIVEKERQLVAEWRACQWRRRCPLASSSYLASLQSTDSRVPAILSYRSMYIGVLASSKSRVYRMEDQSHLWHAWCWKQRVLGMNWLKLCRWRLFTTPHIDKEIQIDGYSDVISISSSSGNSSIS
jgi:hypothetical protein